MAAAFHYSIVLIVGCYAIAETASARVGQKLNISLYYESKCPACDNFIATDLFPVWRKLSGPQYLNIDLIPYGNAQMNKSGYITCQHGPDECKGNVLHNCALHYIPSQDLRLAFVACTFFSPTTQKAGGPCAKLLKIDFRPIRNCTQNGEGEQLHYLAGVRTEQLRPSHEWVPWIIFDGVYNAKDMQDAQQDFFGFVCKKLKGKGLSPPSACAKQIIS